MLMTSKICHVFLNIFEKNSRNLKIAFPQKSCVRFLNSSFYALCFLKYHSQAVTEINLLQITKVILGEIRVYIRLQLLLKGYSYLKFLLR